MTRAISSVVTKNKHRKILKLAKGYRGRSHNCYRIALQKVEKALRYAYRDRRNRKRDFRSLWIQRINAALRANGLVYSKFMYYLAKCNMDINRKMLAQIASESPEVFNAMVQDVMSKAKVA